MIIRPLQESEADVSRRLANTYILPLWLVVVLPCGRKELFCAKCLREIPDAVDAAYSNCRTDANIEVWFQTPTERP